MKHDIRVASPVANLGLMALALMGLGASIVSFLLTDYNGLRGLVLDSDMLYPATLYGDLVHGAGLTGWAFSGASYWFPDMPQYFLLRFVSGDVQSAAILYAIVQVVLFTLGIVVLGRQVIQERWAAHDALLVSLSALYLGAQSLWIANASQLMAVVLHSGVAVAMPYTLALLLHGVFGSSARKSLFAVAIALATLAFLMTASDVFYVVQVAIPAGLALIPVFIWMAQHRRRVVVTVSALMLGAMVGFAADHLSPVNTTVAADMLAPGRASQSLSGLVSTVQAVVAQHPVHGALLAIFLIASAIVTLHEALRVKRDTATVRGGAFVFGQYALWLTAVNAVFVVLTGLFVDANTLRYIMPPILLSTGWGLLLILTPLHDRSAWARWATAGMAIGISGMMLVQLIVNAPHLQQLTQVAAYYPPQLACLDERLPALGVTTGVATYWQARPTGLLSRAGLRVTQVAADLSPYYWVIGLNAFDIEPQSH